jgi:hypothetical protein
MRWGCKFLFYFHPGDPCKEICAYYELGFDDEQALEELRQQEDTKILQELKWKALNYDPMAESHSDSPDPGTQSFHTSCRRQPQRLLTALGVRESFMAFMGRRAARA